MHPLGVLGRARSVLGRVRVCARIIPEAFRARTLQKGVNKHSPGPGDAGRTGGLVQSKDPVVQSKDLVVQSKDLAVHSKDGVQTLILFHGTKGDPPRAARPEERDQTRGRGGGNRQDKDPPTRSATLGAKQRVDQ